jgi:hypothetical protein
VKGRSLSPNEESESLVMVGCSGSLCCASPARDTSQPCKEDMLFCVANCDAGHGRTRWCVVIDLATDFHLQDRLKTRAYTCLWTELAHKTSSEEFGEARTSTRILSRIHHQGPRAVNERVKWEFYIE